MTLDPEQYQQLLLDIRAIVRQEIALKGVSPAHAPDEYPTTANGLLSIREVARLLSVSIGHARTLINTKVIRSYKLGSRSYIKPEDVTAALKQK